MNNLEQVIEFAAGGRVLAHSTALRHRTTILCSLRVDWRGPPGDNSKVPSSGPVAQLGARFHGMEEVIGSIPIRSTNYLLVNVRPPAGGLFRVWRDVEGS